MIRYGGGSSKTLAWNEEGMFQEIPYNESGSPSHIESYLKVFPISIISFRGGNISFTYSNNEQLSSIEIKDSQGTTVKSIVFFQSYSGSGVGLVYNNNKYRHSRLLDSLQINNHKYAFTYGISRQYGDVYDYWGYMAGSPVNACNVPYQTVTLSTGNISKFYDCFPVGTQTSFPVTFGTGASIDDIYRLDNIQRNALTIRYPTGGSTEFIVGQNRFRDPIDQAIKGAGGFRIEKIRSFDGVHVDPINEKVFKYGPDEDGAGILKSLPNFEPFSGNNHQEEIYTYVRTNVPGEPETYNILHTERKRTYFSGATRSLTFSNGAPVNYNTVTEYNSDFGQLTGKTVYKFDLYSFAPEFTSPFDPFPFESNDWNIGMPDSVIHFKYKNGEFYWMQKKNMDYNTYTLPFRIFQGRATLLGNYIIVDGNSPTYTQNYMTENLGNLQYKYSAINAGVMQLTNEELTERDDNGIILNKRTNYY